MNSIIEYEIKLPNITLNVAISDNEKDKPILLLHGYPDVWFGWEEVMKVLINQGFRVIAPDQRGYNLSEKPKGIKAYSPQNMVKDAFDLMTYLGYEKFDLAGHDYGGYIAWSMSLLQPNRIDKLVIVAGLHPMVWQNIRQVSWTQWLRSWYLLFFKLPKIPEWLMTKNDFQYLFYNHSKSLTIEEKQRYHKAFAQPNAVQSMINWYRAKPIQIKNPYLKMPVLILWGEKDLYLTVESAKACLKYCPKGKLEIIENGSHWLLLENVERVGDELKLFLC